MAISRIPITGTDPQQIQSALDRLVSEVNRNINSSNDAKGQRVTNLSRPVSSNDAVPLSYMQDYVDKIVKTAVGKLSIGTSGVEAPAAGIDLVDVRVTDAPPNRTWNADGSLQLNGTREEYIGYYPGYIGVVHLRQIGQLQGVNIYWENASEPTRPLFCGASEYTGSPGSIAPDNIGEIDVTIPRGKLKVGDNYLHLRAYGETRRLKYYPHTTAPLDTYWKITITAQDLVDHPTTVVGTINPPTSVVTIVEDYGQEQVKYGCRWTAPDPVGATVGYEVEFRFYETAGAADDADYYRTFAGYVDGAGATAFYVTDPQPRDAKTVYVRAFVRAFNEDREYGAWVTGTTVTVLPIASGPGQFPGTFSVALTIEPVEAGPAHFWALVDLTPPTYVGGAIQWETEMGYFEQETGGVMTSEWIPLGAPVQLSDAQEMYGPFVRAIGNPLSPPWGQVRTRLILGNGAKTDYVYSTRKVITYAAAPTPTLTNLSYLEYDTISGVPSYRIVRKVTFDGDKTGVDWTNMIAFFYTDSGGTVLDGEIPLGGIDPSLYDAWPITVEDRTDWWALPDYDVWFKIGVAVYNAANTEGTWVYTTLAKMNKSAGFDAGGTDPSSLSTRLLVDGDGNLSAYAITELEKWGMSTADFTTSSGNVIINNAVIDRLLSRSVTITDNLTITRSGSGGVVSVTGDGVTLSKGTASVTIGSSGITLSGGTTYPNVSIGSSNITLNIGVGYALTIGAYGAISTPGNISTTSYMYATKYIVYNESQVPVGTLGYDGLFNSVLNVTHGTFSNDFSHTGGSVTLSTSSAWRTALGLGAAAIMGTGTASNQVALGNHTHAGYATSTHTHSHAEITGDVRFAQWGTDTYDLSSITSVGWVPAYDATGGYRGKIPVI